MAASAQVEFDAKAWQETLNGLRDRWDDIKARRQFTGIVSAVFYRDYIEHFRKQEGPEGAWAPWSKMYAEHMQKKGMGGRNILQISGRLRQTAIPSAGDVVNRGTADGILFYNNAQTKSGFPYAYAHDAGGPKLPARKFMWLSPKAMASIIAQTVKWLAEGAEGKTQSGAG
jgi:phage gpG-like protein